jgi:hypothetical protein
MPSAINDHIGFVIHPQWDFMTRERDTERKRETEEIEAQEREMDRIDRDRYEYERRGGDAISPSEFRQYADERASEAIDRGDDLAEQKREITETREYQRDLDERQVDQYA